ncbi:hypothetical protein, partial [Candidatus Magnetobacterium casense]
MLGGVSAQGVTIYNTSGVSTVSILPSGVSTIALFDQNASTGSAGEYLGRNATGLLWGTPAGGSGGSGLTTVQASDGTEAESTTLGDAPGGIFIVGSQGITSKASGNSVWVLADNVHSQVTTYVQNAVSTIGTGGVAQAAYQNSLLRASFTGATGFAIDTNVSAYVTQQLAGITIAQRGALVASAFTGATDFYGKTTAFVTAQTNRVAFAGITNFAIDGNVTNYVRAYTDRSAFAGITAFAIDGNVTNYVRTYTNRGSFTGITDFAINSNVTNYVRTYTDTPAFTGSTGGVTNFARRSELTTQTGGSPWGGPQTAWVSTGGNSGWATFYGAGGVTLYHLSNVAMSGNTLYLRDSAGVTYLQIGPSGMVLEGTMNVDGGTLSGVTVTSLTGITVQSSATRNAVQVLPSGVSSVYFFDQTNSTGVSGNGIKRSADGMIWTDDNAGTGGGVAQAAFAGALVRSAFTGATGFGLDANVTQYVTNQLAGITIAQRNALVRSAFTGETAFAMDSNVTDYVRLYTNRSAFTGITN